MADLLMIPPGHSIGSAGRYGVGSAARYESARGAKSFACESRRSLRGVLGGTCSARVNRSARRPLRGRRISLRSPLRAAIDPCSTACRTVPVHKRGGGLPRLRPVIRRTQ